MFEKEQRSCSSVKPKIAIRAAACAAVFCLLTYLLPLNARAAPDIGARSALLYEAETGTVLYSKNPDEKLPIASITKIMTALVVLENCDLEDHVQFKRQWALTEGSSSGFREGQWYTVRQLLYALMLASGNDAAIALACHTAGSVGEFAKLMNEKASELGMTGSCFKNPHGLDQKEHYSTSSDMAKLASAAMKNKEFALISSTKEARIGRYRFSNHNKLLWKYPDTIGIKTGYTSSAGRTLVTCAEKNDMTLICVTLDDSDDWDDHALLYDWAGANYKLFTLSSRGSPESLPVISGAKESVPLRRKMDVRLLLNADDTVSLETRLPRFVYAPVTAYDSAGETEIYVNGKSAGKTDIIFAGSVELDSSIPLTFWEKIKWSWRYSAPYFGGRLNMMF